MARLQVIDIGTNSVRSLVVESTDNGQRRVVDDEKEMTKLGTGLYATGMLAPETMERTVEALRAFLAIGENLHAERVRAVATAAVRMADNGPEFRDRLKTELGLEVEVISELEEGRLVFLSAASTFSLPGRTAVVDIGGGSVEVVTAVDRVVEQVVSMPIGVRVLGERFTDSDPISDRAFKRMKKHVRATLAANVARAKGGAAEIVGSGGTVTGIGAVIAAARGARPESLHGLELQRAEVMQLLSLLTHADAAERKRLAGMPPERVDVILPGALVLAEVMKLTGAGSVVINARGIREGIVIDTLEQDRPQPGAGIDRIASARGFGERCSYDEHHATQVATLAASLFDQLAPALSLDTSKRDLLEAAALLHDVGYCVAYDRHHRHSYHLIVHATLAGFTNREVRRIASIARYHTKALPKNSHEAWASLADEDRKVVEPLAAILRLADGLDRGRAGHVRSVEAVLSSDGLTLLVRGEGALHPEVYGVEKKKDLFERAFGVPVSISVESGSR